MGVPDWNGQRQMPLVVIMCVCVCVCVWKGGGLNQNTCFRICSLMYNLQFAFKLGISVSRLTAYSVNIRWQKETFLTTVFVKSNVTRSLMDLKKLLAMSVCTSANSVITR